MFPWQTIAIQIEAIRDRLDFADRHPSADARIGVTMLALSQLVDVVESLSKHIADLERVQNERAGD